MKLIILGLILIGALAACAAPDPTVPVPLATPAPVASQAVTGADVASDRTQEDIIDPSPIATVSSMYANVGDHVFVQVNIPNRRECTDLKVRDPYGNVAIALAPKEIRSDDPVDRHEGGDFVQFRGEFFAPAAGDYLVDLGRDSENIRCGGSPVRRAEVKWTVQPN